MPNAGRNTIEPAAKSCGWRSVFEDEILHLCRKMFSVENTYIARTETCTILKPPLISTSHTRGRPLHNMLQFMMALRLITQLSSFRECRNQSH
jgi:hypothetical protein